MKKLNKLEFVVTTRIRINAGILSEFEEVNEFLETAYAAGEVVSVDVEGE